MVLRSELFGAASEVGPLEVDPREHPRVLRLRSGRILLCLHKRGQEQEEQEPELAKENTCRILMLQVLGQE